MRKDFLPFSRPAISDEDIGAVCQVLRSGWITTGACCARFEKTFADQVEAGAGAVALTSATAGMHLALRALGIGPGDEVVTPSMTWVSTVNLIALAGATPVFAEIDRDTLMVSAATITPCLGPRTRLIVPVHFAGAPVDMDPIRELARERRIPLIEDAAHALGTEYRGRPIGATGTTIFSFHPIKNITTAEGGMFCSDDETFVARIRRLKFHGLGADAHDRQTQGRHPHAEVLEPGYKYNLPDMAAALGLSQLGRLALFNARRTALAARYLELLAGVPEILPLGLPTYPMKHAWHLFIVRLDTDRTRLGRDEFMEALKEKNIGTGLHFRAVHLHRYYLEQGGTRRGMLPDTEWNSDRIFSLPLFPDMAMADVEDVVEAVKEVLAR